MPWRYMRLRDNRVLARCDDDGELSGEGGRVEIRYRSGKSKAYRAALRNLQPDDDTTILPEAHCLPADPPEVGSSSARKPGEKGASKRAGKAKGGASPRTTPDDGELLAYADGACSGNPGPAGLGVVALSGRERRTLSEYLGKATNNIAELTAILRAAELAKELGLRLTVFTDSNYSIGVLQKGWKAKANKELVAEVKAALGRLREWELHHVRGHAGIELNELADELAVLAVKDGRTTGWICEGRSGGRRPPG